jgi:hypothetical protein
MSLEGQGKSRGKRSQGRLEVRLQATLQTRSGTQSAILENISKSGAKLRATNPPAAGSDVILRWHEHEAFGSISWTSATHCGLRFPSILSPAQLQATLALDDIAHVPEELDDAAAAAKAWAEGSIRVGLD